MEYRYNQCRYEIMVKRGDEIGIKADKVLH